MTVPLKFKAASAPSKYIVYTQFIAANAFLIHWGMADRNYFREIKKHCTLKNYSLRLNTVAYKGKMFFYK